MFQYMKVAQMADAASTTPTTGGDLHVSRSATRALDLVDIVVTAGSISLTEAAEASGIPTSTTLRHLRALMGKGWLTRDSAGNFSVGPTFLRLGINAFREGPWARLTTAALPHLETLATVTQESAYLAVRDGSEAVYLSTVESPRAIRHAGWVGRSVPLKDTAVGEALVAPLAFGPIPVFRNVGAVEEDATALCVPIADQGVVVGAFSLLGPNDRMTAETDASMAAALRDASAALTLDLSGG